MIRRAMLLAAAATEVAGALLPSAALPAGPPVSPAATAPLRARFIGNAAFEITDGSVTLLTDFPYRSGAFGYMTYDRAELAPRPRALCLFTHSHADHFEAGLIARIGCTAAGPASVLSRLLGGSPALPASLKLSFPPLSIVPVPTEHGGAGHASYRVEWNGARLYFTGDTESTAELAREKDLDALFITPWLLAAARAAGSLPASRRIVVFHHRDRERLTGCDVCLVPRRGESFEIPVSPAPTPPR